MIHFNSNFHYKFIQDTFILTDGRTDGRT
jgi:hypothetical protein